MPLFDANPIEALSEVALALTCNRRGSVFKYGTAEPVRSAVDFSMAVVSGAEKVEYPSRQR
jgi:hypothetical protein